MHAIASEWSRVMMSCIQQDVKAASPRMGWLATSARLIHDTWRNVIMVQNGPREDWVCKINRVLVGIDPSIVAAISDGSESHTGLNGHA